jgi:threonine/homoserine/homoserine lactone efflux protein
LSCSDVAQAIDARLPALRPPTELAGANLLHPKVGVFYVTLLPQFIPHGGSVIAYGFLFTLIHFAEGILWLTLPTVAVRPLHSWLALGRRR